MNTSERATAEKLDVPRLAFLGFCDRLAEITNGHPLLWYRDLIGLSNNRVSHIFPFNLNGQKLVVAIYSPREGDEFKLVFRGTANRQVFEITMKAGVSQIPGAQSPAATETTAESLHVPGWVLAADDVPADVMVIEPDSYNVYCSCYGSECYVGTATFAHAALPPFSQEEIAAIRSDPLGAKHIKIRVGCKFCSSALRAYAALERMDSIESEGWLWSQGIQEERFSCECGKTSFGLVPIRTGLHGLLRRNLNPRADSIISTVRQYERSALEQSCRRFLELVKSAPVEEGVQNFLEENPIFFHPFLPRKLMFKKPVLTKYFVDFAILNSRQELLLIEIEKPSLRLLKKDGGITAGLQHALDQVRDWIQVFDDHRVAALDAFNLKVDEVAKVRGVVIAGRNPDDENRARSLRSTSWGEIDVFTYDDLLRGCTEIVKHLANV